MLRGIIELVGISAVGYGAYLIGHKRGIKDAEEVHRDDFENGVQVGFKTAPDIYRKMVENGDIERVPEGMSLGEIGKVFRTLEEAKTARLIHQFKSGEYNVEDILIFDGTDKFDAFYILVNREAATRKG